jgi:hypothetical protein
LKYEIRREPLPVSSDGLVELLDRDVVQLGKINVQKHRLAPEKQDPALGPHMSSLDPTCREPAGQNVPIPLYGL